MIISSNLSFYHSRMAFFLANQQKFNEMFSIVKQVNPWVDLLQSNKVGLSQGGSKAATLCEVSHLALFFLALFLLSVMNTITFMTRVTFFQKRKLLLCKFSEEQFSSIGECVHLWIDWSGSEKAERSQGSRATNFCAERECPGNAGLAS